MWNVHHADHLHRPYWAYSLSSADIDMLSLARDNYAGDLFLHPPVFTMMTYAVYYGLGLPLVYVPLLCTAMTSLVIILLVRELLQHHHDDEDDDKQRHEDVSVSAMMWALLIFGLCPISVFVSQKLWIDNALALTSTVTVLMHMRMQRKSSRGVFLFSQALSGAVYGALALCTKITALALLPGLLLMTCVGAARCHDDVDNEHDDAQSAVDGDHHHDDKYDDQSQVRRHRNKWNWMVIALMGMMSFVCGAAVASAPWYVLYAVRSCSP